MHSHGAAFLPRTRAAWSEGLQRRFAAQALTRFVSSSVLPVSGTHCLTSPAFLIEIESDQAQVLASYSNGLPSAQVAEEIPRTSLRHFKTRTPLFPYKFALHCTIFDSVERNQCISLVWGSLSPEFRVESGDRNRFLAIVESTPEV